MIRLGQPARVTLSYGGGGKPFDAQGELHPAAGGPDDAHAEGAPRSRQSGTAAEARHVRGRGIPRRRCRGASPCRPKPCWIPASARPSSWIAATATSNRGRWKSGERDRRPHRDSQGPEAGRADRHLRQLPDRFGKPAEGGGRRHGGHARNRRRCPRTERTSMINRIIEFSGRQQVPGLHAGRRCGGRRASGRCATCRSMRFRTSATRR